MWIFGGILFVAIAAVYWAAAIKHRRVEPRIAAIAIAVRASAFTVAAALLLTAALLNRTAALLVGLAAAALLIVENRTRTRFASLIAAQQRSKHDS